MVKNLPSNAGDVGSSPGLGDEIPHAVGQLTPYSTYRQKPMHCSEEPSHCNKRSHMPQRTATKTQCSQLKAYFLKVQLFFFFFFLNKGMCPWIISKSLLMTMVRTAEQGWTGFNIRSCSNSKVTCIWNKGSYVICWIETINSFYKSRCILEQYQLSW